MKTKTWTIIFCLLLGLLAACQSKQDDTANEQNDTNQKDAQIEENIEDSSELQLPEASLQKQDEGEHVLALQKALNQIGYNIPDNGVYSEATTWAITDFQLQSEHLAVTGIYNSETRDALIQIIEQNDSVAAGNGLPQPAAEAFTSAGSKIIGNPYDVLAVINKEAALPEDYVPYDLIVPDVQFTFKENYPIKQLREPAAINLEKLFAAAEDAGYQLVARSGYRSYETQSDLFSAYARERGEEAANLFSARPGESEHQTGLAMDITSHSVNYQLTTAFGDTPEGVWVKENAHQYGFIIRYPDRKEEITQYQFEPWHLRYVGERAAKEIAENGLTLEEYFSEEN